MTNYEKLLSNADDNNVAVYDNYDLKGTRLKGLYCDSTVAISSDLRTQKKRPVYLQRNLDTSTLPPETY